MAALNDDFDLNLETTRGVEVRTAKHPADRAQRHRIEAMAAWIIAIDTDRLEHRHYPIRAWRSRELCAARQLGLMAYPANRRSRRTISCGFCITELQ